MLCDICGLYEAKYTCRLCGRRVCEHDYIHDEGVCTVCRDARCRICGRYLAVGYCSVCGRIGCSDCLIQVDLVTYMCRECYVKTGGLIDKTR